MTLQSLYAPKCLINIYFTYNVYHLVNILPDTRRNFIIEFIHDLFCSMMICRRKKRHCFR